MQLVYVFDTSLQLQIFLVRLDCSSHESSM